LVIGKIIGETLDEIPAVAAEAALIEKCSFCVESYSHIRIIKTGIKSNLKIDII